MARTRERAAFIHRVRLVLDKLTKQKLRNFDLLRMVTVSLMAGRMQITDRKTTLTQFVKQLSDH